MVLAACAACAAPSWMSAPHDRLYQRTPPPALHEKPRPTLSSDWWFAFYQSGVRPLRDALSPAYYYRLAAGSPEPLDVNAFGQVIDSAWFFNRISRYELSPEEAARGPNRLKGPAPGVFDVLGGKLEGATPGLVVRDEHGDSFVVKFDPPAFPELSSGAEVISTKILHAAGYNVPENYVAKLPLDRLRLAPGAVTRGDYGAEIPLTQERLDDLVSHVNPYPDGTVRALFSRIIGGEILGPFSYSGRRSDDPNDLIPHEQRRSLRGLGMFAAWINNSDTRGTNTLDTFLPSASDPKLGYVKHYLIDFGDSLGAAGVHPKYVGQGYQHRIDWAEIGASFFSLGIYYPYWLPVQRAPFRSVGVFEGAVFDPARWSPTIPNPAFEEADLADRYWAASIIARFTPDQLAAIVAQGRYSEPGAAAWVLRVLSVRQFAILDYAFARILPLEDPAIADGAVLSMTDLAVTSGLDHSPRRYAFEVWWHRASDELIAIGTADVPRLDLSSVLPELRLDAEHPFLTVAWRLAGAGESPTTSVHLRFVGERLIPVGLTRRPI